MLLLVILGDLFKAGVTELRSIQTITGAKGTAPSLDKRGGRGRSGWSGVCGTQTPVLHQLGIKRLGVDAGFVSGVA